MLKHKVKYHHLRNVDMDKIKKQIPEDVLSMISSKEFRYKTAICGGFIRSIITNSQVNDVDIYFSDEKTFNTFYDAFLRKFDGGGDLYKKKELVDIHKTSYAITIKYDTVKIQVICYNYIAHHDKDSFKEAVLKMMLLHFDYTINKAAIFYDNKGELSSICCDSFYNDLEKKILTPNPKKQSIKRMVKFIRLGYSFIDNSSAIDTILNECSDSYDNCIERNLNFHERHVLEENRKIFSPF